MRKILIITAIVVIFVFISAVALYFAQNKNILIDNDYRAIFLDNNQVYFAKIKNMGEKYITITDIYYFGRDSSAGLGQADTEDVVLVKLGSEMHGPTDEMQILENHILYIEKLSDDSRVVEAIKEHKGTK